MRAEASDEHQNDLFKPVAAILAMLVRARRTGQSRRDGRPRRGVVVAGRSSSCPDSGSALSMRTSTASPNPMR
jgi:hypothetical protein